MELLNFGAFAGFVLVNLSVIHHYFIHLRLRRGLAFLFNLVFPVLGALVCSYVWMSLTIKAKLVGFAWLIAGRLTFVPRRHAEFAIPKQLSFEEQE